MAVERKDSSTPEIMGTEEASARAIQEMNDPSGNRLYTMSDVTPREVFDLTRIALYAKVFGSTLLDKFQERFLLLRNSRFRMGRRENLLIITGVREIEAQKKKGKTTDLYSGLK